jgi:hypothetical protein
LNNDSPNRVEAVEIANLIYDDPDPADLGVSGGPLADPQNREYGWIINGGTLAETSHRLSPGTYVRGDALQISARISDGTAFSSWFDKAITIDNAPPNNPNIIIFPASISNTVYASNDLICLPESTDPDGGPQE